MNYIDMLREKLFVDASSNPGGRFDSIGSITGDNSGTGGNASRRIILSIVTDPNDVDPAAGVFPPK